MATMRLCLLLVASAVRAEPLSDALSAQWEALQALEVAALVRPALKDALRWQRDTLDAFQHAYPDVQTPPHPPKVAYSESLVAGLPAEKRDSLLYTHLEKAKVSEELALARLKHHQGASLSSMAAENVTMLQTEALHALRDTERLMEKADSEQEQALAAHLGKLGNALNAEPTTEPVTPNPPRAAAGEGVTPRLASEKVEAPCNVSVAPKTAMEDAVIGMCTPAMKKLLGDAFPCDPETLAKNASRVSQQADEDDAVLAAIEARAVDAANKAADLRRAANETAHAKEEKQSEVDALEKAKAAADEKAKNAVDKEMLLSAEAYRAMSAAAMARKAGEEAERVAEHARLERQQKDMEEHERRSIENGENPAEAARHLAREETIKAQAETVRALVRAMVKGTVGLEEPLRNARTAMQRMMEAARADNAADRRAPSTVLRKSQKNPGHVDPPPDTASSNSTPAASPMQAVDDLVNEAQKAANAEIEALSKRTGPAKLARSAAALNLLAQQPGANVDQDKAREAYLRGDALGEAKKAAASALRMARADAAGCSTRGEHGCEAKADAVKAATAVVSEIDELVASTERAEALATAKQASLLKNIHSVTGGKAAPASVALAADNGSEDEATPPQTVEGKTEPNEKKRKNKKAMKQQQKQLHSTLHEALMQKAAAQDRADQTEMRATLAEEALRHAAAEHARGGRKVEVSTARNAMVNATATIMTEHARRVAAQETVTVLKRQVNEAEAAKTRLKNKGRSFDSQDKTVADLKAQLEQAIKREHDTSARVSEVQKQMGVHKQHLIEVAKLAQEQEQRRKNALVEAEEKIADQSKALKLAQQEAEEAHEELAAAVAEKENVLMGLAEKDASTSFAEAEHGRMSALLLQKEQELQQKEPTILEAALNEKLRHNDVLREHIEQSREQTAKQLAEVLAAAKREKEVAVQGILKQKQIELEQAIMTERRKARKQQTQQQLQAVQTARSHKESVERLRKQLDATSAELEYTREVSIDSISNETKLRMLATDKVTNLEKQVHQAITGNMKSGKEFSQNLAIHKVARLEAEQERSTLATQLKQIEMEAKNNLTAFKLAELQWQVEHNRSLELIRQEAHNQTEAAAAATQREAEAKLSAHKLKTEQEQARLSTWKVQAERSKIEEAAARRVAEHIANERAAAAKAEKALKEAEEERLAASEAIKTKDDAVHKAADLEIEAVELRKKLVTAAKDKEATIKQVKLADYKEHLSVLAATDMHLEQLEQEQEEQRAHAAKLEEERNQRVNYLYNETKELRLKLARKDKMIEQKTLAIKRKEAELANRTNAQEEVVVLGGKLSEVEEKLQEQRQKSLEKLRSQRRNAHTQYAALEDELKKKTSEHSIALVAARNETDAQVSVSEQMLLNAEQLLIEAKRNATEQLTGAETRHAAALAASQQRYEQAVKDSETASSYMEGEVQKMAEEHKLKEAELHRIRHQLESEKTDTVERVKGEAVEYVQKIKGDANAELQRIRDEAQGLVTKVRGDAGAKVLESEQKLADEARRRSAAQEKAVVLESQINDVGHQFEAMSSEMYANLTRISRMHTEEGAAAAAKLQALEAKLTKQQQNAVEKMKAQKLLAQEQLAQQTKAADHDLLSVRKATDDVLHEAEVRLEEAKRVTAEHFERRRAAQETATVLASNLSATEGALAQASGVLAAAEDRHRLAQKQNVATLRSHRATSQAELQAQRAALQKELDSTRNASRVLLEKQKANMQKEIDVVRNGSQIRLENQKAAAQRELESYMKNSQIQLESQKAAMEARLEQAKKITDEQEERLHEALGITEEELAARHSAQEKATVLATNLSTAERMLANTTKSMETAERMMAAAEARHRAKEQASIQALRNHRSTSQLELTANKRKMETSHNEMVQRLTTQQKQLEEAMKQQQLASQHALQEQQRAADQAFKQERLEHQTTRLAADEKHASELEQTIANLTSQLATAAAHTAGTEAHMSWQQKVNVEAMRKQRAVAQSDLTEALAKIKAENEANLTALHALAAVDVRHLEEELQHEEAEKALALKKAADLDAHRRSAQEKVQELSASLSATAAALEHTEKQMNDQQQQGLEKLKLQGQQWEDRTAKLQQRLVQTMHEKEADVKKAETALAAADSHIREVAQKALAEKQALAAEAVQALQDERRRAGEEKAKLEAARRATEKRAERHALRSALLAANLTTSEATLQETIATYTSQLREAEKRQASTESKMSSQQKANIESMRAHRAAAQRELGETHGKRIAAQEKAETLEVSLKQTELKRASAQETAAVLAANLSLAQDEMDKANERLLAQRMQAKETMMLQRRHADEALAVAQERLERERSETAAQFDSKVQEMTDTVTSIKSQHAQALSDMMAESQAKVAELEGQHRARQKLSVDALRQQRALAQAELQATLQKQSQEAEKVQADLRATLEQQRQAAEETLALQRTEAAQKLAVKHAAAEKALKKAHEDENHRHTAEAKSQVLEAQLKETEEQRLAAQQRSEQLMESANKLNTHVQQMHAQHEEELTTMNAQHNATLAEMQVRSVALEAALNAVSTRHRKHLEQSQLESAAASLVAQNEASEHQKALDLAASKAASLDAKLTTTQKQMEAQKASMLTKLKEQRAAAEMRTHELEAQMASQGSEADIRLTEAKRTAEEQLASMDELLKKTTANADAVMARELQRLNDEHNDEMAEVKRQHEANMTSLTALGAVELREAEEAAAENLAAFEAEATSKVEEVGRLMKDKEESMQTDAAAKLLALEQQAAERVSAQVQVAVEAEAKQREAERALRDGLEAMKKSLNEKDERMSDVHKAHIENIRALRAASQQDLQHAKDDADKQLADALHKVELAKAEADAISAEAAANKARVQERAAVLAANLTTTELQLAAAEAELRSKDEVLRERETALLAQITQKEEELHSLHESSAAEHQKLMAEKAVQLSQMRQSTADEHTRRLRELETERDQKVSALVEERQALLQERDQKLGELNADRKAARDQAAELEKKLASMQKMSIEKLRAQRLMAQDEAAQLEKQLRSQAQEQVSKVREQAVATLTAAESAMNEDREKLLADADARASELETSARERLERLREDAAANVSAVQARRVAAQEKAQALTAEAEQHRVAAQEKAQALTAELGAKQVQMDAQHRLATMKLQGMRTEAERTLEAERAKLAADADAAAAKLKSELTESANARESELDERLKRLREDAAANVTAVQARAGEAIDLAQHRAQELSAEADERRAAAQEKAQALKSDLDAKQAQMDAQHELQTTKLQDVRAQADKALQEADARRSAAQERAATLESEAGELKMNSLMLETALNSTLTRLRTATEQHEKEKSTLQLSKKNALQTASKRLKQTTDEYEQAQNHQQQLLKASKEARKREHNELLRAQTYSQTQNEQIAALVQEGMVMNVSMNELMDHEEQVRSLQRKTMNDLAETDQLRQSAETRLHDLEQQHSAAKEHVKALQANLMTTTEDVTAVEQARVSAQERADALDGRRKAAQERATVLEQNVTELEEHGRSLASQMQEQREVLLKTIQHQRTNSDKELQAVTDRAAAMAAEKVAESELELKAAQLQAESALSGAKTEAEEKIAALKRDHENTILHVRAEDAAQLEKAEADAREQSATAHEKLLELEAAHRAASNRVVALEVEANETNVKMAAYEATVAAAAEHLKRKTAELEEAQRAQASDFEGKLAESDSAHSATKKQLELHKINLEQVRTDARTQLSEAWQRREAAQERAGTLEKSLSQSKDELEKLHGQKEAAQEKAAALDQLAEQMQQAMEDSEEQTKTRMAEMSSLHTDKLRQQRLVSEKREDELMHQFNDTIADESAHRAAAQEKVAALSASGDELQHQFEDNEARRLAAQEKVASLSTDLTASTDAMAKANERLQLQRLQTKEAMLVQRRQTDEALEVEAARRAAAQERTEKVIATHSEKLQAMRRETDKREITLQHQFDDEATRRLVAQEKVSALVATADEMSAAMAQMENQYGVTDGKRVVAQARVSELQAETTTLNGHAKELEAAVLKANDDLKKNAAVYKLAVDSAKLAATEHKAELEARVQSVLDEKQALTQQRESAMAQATVTQNQLDDLKERSAAAHEAMKKKLHDAEREQREQTEKYSAQLDKTDVLLSRAQEKARREAQRYQAELAETDGLRADEASRRMLAQEKVSALAATAGQMSAAMDQLDNNLTTSEKHADQLKSAVTTTMAELLTAEQRRETAQARAGEAQSHAADNEARRDAAEKKAVELESKLSEYELMPTKAAEVAKSHGSPGVTEYNHDVAPPKPSRRPRAAALYASEESNEWAAVSTQPQQQQGNGESAPKLAPTEPQSAPESAQQTAPQPEPSQPEAAWTEEQQRAASTEAALTAELEAERSRRHSAQEELSVVTRAQEKQRELDRVHASTLVASRTDYSNAPEAKDLVAALSAEKQRRMGAQEQLSVQREEIASVVPIFQDALLKKNASELEAKRLTAEVNTLRREAAEAKSALEKGAQGHAVALKALTASQQQQQQQQQWQQQRQQWQQQQAQQQQRHQQQEEELAIQRLQLQRSAGQQAHQAAAMVESEARPAQVEAAAGAMRAAMAAFGEAIGAGGRAELAEPMHRQHAALLALAAAFPRADADGVLDEASEADAQLKSASVAAGQGQHPTMDAAAQGLQQAEEARAHAAQALQLLSTIGKAHGQQDSARVGSVVGMQQSVLRELQDAEGASEESLAREMRELEARQSELLSETAEQSQPTPR